MNELPRQKLSEIVAKYGRSIVENPRRLEGLLRDYCGAFRREISVLVMAVEEHAVLDMLAADSSALPRRVLLTRLARRLCDNLAISDEAAIWAVESWALALGLISGAEIISNKAVAKPEEITVEVSVSSASSVAPKTASTTVKTQTTSQNQNSFIVAVNGGGHFTSIGEALRNVAPNSRLLVREGVYDESIVIDKNVEIIGDGAAENIIIRSTNSSPIVMRAGQARLRGVTVRGLGARGGKSFFAVAVPGGELILENCDISSDSLSGVAIYGVSANPLIKNCRIHGCADSGFYIFNNARARIEDCNIFGNTNVSVAVTQGANAQLKNCLIYDGEDGGVVFWGNGATGLIEDCRIYNHRLSNVGIREYASPTFRGCEIFGGRDTGVFVHQNGYGLFEDCRIYRNASAEVGVSQMGSPIFRQCAIYDGENSGVILQDRGRATLEGCNIYDNEDAGVAVYGESKVAVMGCNIHRNKKVAIRIKEQSAARVENCDLRGNFMATWETDYGITLEEENNRES